MFGRAVIMVAVAALGLGALAPAAGAQPFPFPFGGGDEAPKKKKAKQAEDPKAAEESAKVYTKPEPRALPEGPARALSGAIALVKFDGIVNPGMGEYVADAIERATREEKQLVLIELNTPGGLVSTTQKMVQAILGARIPVVVYVTPSGAHAASAGTFITLAGHVAAMAPATRIGAAHPVTGGGKDPEEEGGKHMAAKVVNDLVALAEGIAKERNRNLEWTVDAVKDSISVNADKALEWGVIDLVARDRQELLEKLDGWQLVMRDQKVELATRGAVVEEYEPSLRSRLLNLLANPGIAMLLGVLGLIGIMVEIYHPGLIAPGVMGVLCILCSLIAMEQLPIDVGAAILVVAGIGLLLAEIYTPTYGALGILGGLGLTVGLLLLVDPSNPDFAIDPGIRLGPKDVAPIVAALAGFVGYLSYFVVRSRRGPAVTGSEALIGAVGKVLQPVGPEHGQVFVDGEYWQARATESIPRDEEVEVVKVDGLRLEVRRRVTL